MRVSDDLLHAHRDRNLRRPSCTVSTSTRFSSSRMACAGWGRRTRSQRSCSKRRTEKSAAGRSSTRWAKSCCSRCAAASIAPRAARAMSTSSRSGRTAARLTRCSTSEWRCVDALPSHLVAPLYPKSRMSRPLASIASRSPTHRSPGPLPAARHRLARRTRLPRGASEAREVPPRAGRPVGQDAAAVRRVRLAGQGAPPCDAVLGPLR